MIVHEKALTVEERPPPRSVGKLTRPVMGEQKKLLADTEPPGWTDNLRAAAEANMYLGIFVASAAVLIVGGFLVFWYIPRKG
jgi:hypothetical protein